MSFSGELKAIGFSTVFQGVQNNRSSGTLRISTDRHDLHVYFRDGRITMASPLRLAPERIHLTDGRVKNKHRDKNAIEAGLRVNNPAAAALRAELQRAVLERICEAFEWDGAQFEFTEGEPRDHVFSDAPAEAGFALEVEPILMEAARRDDEWSRIREVVPSLDEWFVRTERAQVGSELPGGLGGELLARMTGDVPLRDLMTDLSESRFAVCKAAAELLQGGWIGPLAKGGRIEVARRLQAQRRTDTALQVLKGVIGPDESDPTLHEFLGDLYAERGRTKGAARAYAQAARAYAENDDVDSAVDAFGKAIDQRPRDPKLHEERLELLSSRGRSRAVATYGAQLGALYESLKDFEKARDVYGRLVSLDPSSESLQKRLAACKAEIRPASRSGGIPASKRISSGLERCRNLFRRGPGAAGKPKGKRVRRRTAVFSLGACVMLFGVGYEVAARTRFNRVQHANVALVAKRHHLEAVEALRSVAEAYPWSVARIEASGLIEELIAQQLREIEADQPITDPEAALRVLDGVLTMVPTAELEKRTERAITRIRLEQRIMDYAAALADPVRRKAARRALEQTTDPNARPVLERLLTHKTELVRFVALAPIVTIGAFDSCSAVVERLRDKSKRVRERAATALVVLSGRKTDDDDYERWSAWLASQEE